MSKGLLNPRLIETNESEKFGLLSQYNQDGTTTMHQSADISMDTAVPGNNNFGPKQSNSDVSGTASSTQKTVSIKHRYSQRI